MTICWYDKGNNVEYEQRQGSGFGNKMFMRLMVNGKPFDFTSGNMVQQLLQQLHLADRPVAVERNGQIVPHSTFDQTELNEEDTLEVLTLVGGG